MKDTQRIVNKKILRERLSGLGLTDYLRSNRVNDLYLMFSLHCNLHCNFCSFWGVTGSCHEKEFFNTMKGGMSRKDIDAIADGIASFKVRTVTFSGGEPLLFKNWYYAAKKFKEAGATISLTTNGVLVEQYIKEIEEVIDEVNISLQAPPEAIHFVRNDPPEHMRDIVRGLKKLNVLKEKHNNRPRLKLLGTISDMNYKYLDKLVLFMKNNKIKIDQYGFQHMMFLNEATSICQKKIFSKEFGITKTPLWDGFSYPFQKTIDFKDFGKRLQKLSKHNNVTFSPCIEKDELENYYVYHKKPERYEDYCIAPWTQLNVLPNGDFYVCNDYVIGNIKERSFAEIWNGPKARRLRKYVGTKLFPACWRCFYYYCDREQ